MPSHCDACPCPETPRQVYGTGPTTGCRYLALGAGPGKVESKTLRAYSGLAGQELDDTYLPLSGLDREACAVSNVTRCWDGTDRPIPDKRVQSCARWHLPQLLAQTQPEVLVLMGGATCRIVDPLPTLDGEHRRLRLDLHRGVPQWGSVLDGLWFGWIWPMFEPALGMRDTPRMTQLLTDWTNFGRWIKGEWRPPQPDERPADYRLVRDIGALYEYLDCPAAEIEQGLDTESHGRVPFSIQISHTPGAGRMMLWEDRAVVRAFARWVEEHPAVDWYLHFAAHDLDECEKMGVRLPRFYDTLQEAYHQCSLPQGLKPLVYRLFGVTMRGWEDVVLPASRGALVEWGKRAMEIAARALSDVEVTTYKRGVCADCLHAHLAKPCGRGLCGCTNIPSETGRVTYSKSEPVAGAVEKILRHILRYTESTEDADDPYDPWEALTRMKVEGLRGAVAEGWEWETLERELGPAPILGIGNAAIEDAVAYAVSDASWTLAVARELRVRRGSDRWKVDVADWDLAMVQRAW